MLEIFENMDKSINKLYQDFKNFHKDLKEREEKKSEKKNKRIIK